MSALLRALKVHMTLAVRTEKVVRLETLATI